MSSIERIHTQYQATILNEKRVKAGLRAEELREKLDPEAAITELHGLMHEADTCLIEDLPRLKFKAEILTTILKKCMPDLRSLEVKEKSSSQNVLTINMVKGRVEDE
jgi:hypothetical protein